MEIEKAALDAASKLLWVNGTIDDYPEIAAIVQAAILAERERCAKVAESTDVPVNRSGLAQVKIAAAIRAKGE